MGLSFVFVLIMLSFLCGSFIINKQYWRWSKGRYEKLELITFSLQAENLQISIKVITSQQEYFFYQMLQSNEKKLVLLQIVLIFYQCAISVHSSLLQMAKKEHEAFLLENVFLLISLMQKKMKNSVEKKKMCLAHVDTRALSCKQERHETTTWDLSFSICPCDEFSSHFFCNLIWL